MNYKLTITTGAKSLRVKYPIPVPREGDYINIDGENFKVKSIMLIIREGELIDIIVKADPGTVKLKWL